DQEGALSIYDVTGKVIWSTNKAFKRGRNTINISASDLNTTGILYYRLDAGRYTATRKMIILE
ncbi:MAG: T9SS type A sorting domain-containing protein, partial [Bacteroidia bacterium]|nr:T9SS type A sorting domain-containing protein [Bacteroidia bacterium]